MHYELYKLTVTNIITGNTFMEYEYGSSELDAMNNYLEKHEFLNITIERAFRATEAELMEAAVSNYVKQTLGSF